MSITGYLYFDYNGQKVRVAYFNGEPTLYAVYKTGWMPLDMSARWRSIISKRKQKEILKFMTDTGLATDVKETATLHERELRDGQENS